MTGRNSMEPPIQVFTVPLEIKEVPSSLSAGLRVQWVTGKTPTGDEFDLTCGAGVGSPYATLEYGGRQFVFTVADLLPTLLQAIDELDRVADEAG